MALAARVSGNSQWGGSIGAFTAYKIEVFYKGKEWTIYRRYSQFEKLHKKLCSELGATYTIILPEKENMGTFGSNFSFVVNKRMISLHDYCATLCEFDNIDSIDCVVTFFDFANFGASGPTVELGLNRIVKQAAANVKHSQYPIFDMWKHCYLVLAKTGHIYVLKSMYDTTSQALVTVSLTNGNILLTSKPSYLIADILCQSDESHLLLKFSTKDELASWLRALGDFTVSENSNRSADTSTGAAQSPAPNSAKKGIAAGGGGATPFSNKKGGAPVPQTRSDVHAKGTGATSDQLSSMYGI